MPLIYAHCALCPFSLSLILVTLASVSVSEYKTPRSEHHTDWLIAIRQVTACDFRCEPPECGQGHVTPHTAPDSHFLRRQIIKRAVIKVFLCILDK